MPKKISTTKTGFTIIEVVLVLAIAGLIFLMVFVALPALQRSQRDTQRRDDVGRLVTAVTTYKANTGGMPGVLNSAISADNDNFVLKEYINDFKDPGTSNPYKVQIIYLNSGEKDKTAPDGQMNIYENAECSGQKAQYKKGQGYFAVVSYAENGGTICQDNS